MQIGFTGTRQGMTPEQKRAVTEYLEDRIPLVAVHHGLCIGADADFHNIAKSLGIPIIGHPPIKKNLMADLPREDFKHIYSPRPYLVRNRAIVRYSDAIYATPKEFKETVRSGTWHTIRHARQQNLNVTVIYPDGNVEYL